MACTAQYFSIKTAILGENIILTEIAFTASEH